MENHSTRNRSSMKWLSLLIMVVLVFAGLSSSVAFSQGPGDGPVATMVITATKIEWHPQVKYEKIFLTVAGPGDVVYRQEFAAGQTPVFELSKGNYPDGAYTYELVVALMLDEETLAAMKKARETGQPGPDLPSPLAQSGVLSIQKGAFVQPIEEPVANPPGGSPTEDVVHYDDLIVIGSECVGVDCVNGENFGFDTIRLKENNLRIKFQDTSSSGAFPTNDWQLTANDSANGGANYFAIDDVDNGKTPFKIIAGARSNAIYVDSIGRVGFGTSTPAVEAHIRDSDTPTVRLEQDSSGGWTAQTWDLAGNESNFFIRDVTNGSKLPFRIQPSAPSNSIFIKGDGNIGMGTSAPGYPLEIERTGSNAELMLERTSGAQVKATALAIRGQFGTVSDHPMFFMANNSAILKLLNAPEATTNAKFVVQGTQRVSGDLYVDGTIHGTVAKGDSAAVEALQAENTALKARVETLESDNATLQGQVSDLEKRMVALEAKVAGGKDPAVPSLPSSFLPGAGLLLAGLCLPVGLVWVARRGRGK
ncbi:MAG: hypothetical protein KKA73_29250 [Chloroflexi bacterium]|nr:hypothetical protein [Chloroflexota bacterium]MBU1751783.1 hypothetical protein [Chloroflexota bacterium]